jgi:predicted RNA methylase
MKGDRPINPSFPKNRKKEKGSYPTDFTDLIYSEAPDKTLDKWAQHKKEAEHCIKFLTAEYDIVLDPFLGQGTTGIACMNLNRRFIGIDIDPKKIEATKANPAFYEYQNQERSEELDQVREKERQLHKMLRGKGKLKF